MHDRFLKVLLVEDDEDDYVLVRDMLAEISTSRYKLEWARSPEEALSAGLRERHDVCLLDYRLGTGDGIQLLRDFSQKCFGTPVILLTGHGGYSVDIEAMRAGAVDFLVKRGLNAQTLEKSIRYAVERKRVEDDLRRSEARLKLLSSQLMNVQEEERQRISRDLHDGIGQLLSAIKFKVEAWLLGRGPHDRRKRDSELKAIVPLVQQCIEEIRRIQRDLRPASIDDLGIVATLDWFTRDFQTVYAHIAVEKDISIQEEDVPERLKIVIFRIVQEAFNNMAKHSHADRGSLLLAREGDRLTLLIGDNGDGFDLASHWLNRERRGLGLGSMKERTEHAGGDLAIETAPGQGTLIRATWPLG